MKSALKASVMVILALILAQTSLIMAQPATGSPFSRIIPDLKKAIPGVAEGKTIVTIVMQASEVPQLFPADPKKRQKGDFKALITDGKNTFLATLSPGGQSSLTVDTPNLRVSDVEEVVPEGEKADKKRSATLAGVPILDASLRLNPMTMDEGYINSLTYISLVNHFSLLPATKTPLTGEYAKVVYRFVNEKNEWTKAVHPTSGVPLETIQGGLHLVNFHPVKFLKEIDGGDVSVLAVARSRYNIQNRPDQLKKLFGKPVAEDPNELFASTEVKTEPVCPFRVELKWGKKNKAEKELSKPVHELSSIALMKELLVRAYAAPKKLSGKELHAAWSAILNLPQLFRFMAINRLIENGDISDEFFWYLERNGKTGETRLGIMPQDGDDMFTGAHMFPFSPRQIGLIIKDSKPGKKLGLRLGYIMNYEDPLFRVIKEDSYLYVQYLTIFQEVAAELAKPATLDGILGKIAQQIEPYSRDHDILDRGQTDARRQGYTPASFGQAVSGLKQRIRGNAEAALQGLLGSSGKPGDLAKARQAAGQP